MTGNISFLLDFEEFNGGYVAFGGNPKGGKISGKGKIKTGKLDFDDVYFVKELKFNLFSVSQMCNKKNIVLFTDIECVVLSSDFKLPDENHVLLRVPRENNMYNVDLKNDVSSSNRSVVPTAVLNRSGLVSLNAARPVSTAVPQTTVDKTGLGYDSQVFDRQVFDCEDLSSYESDDSVPTSLENDRYKIGEGYHVVPPPYTGTFMPYKPNLVFNDAPNACKTVSNMVNVESSSHKPSKDMSKPFRPDAPIIED
nr:putative ribonuclease H-like domain-containing protein [Tanacetum cinerariifolium]